MKLEKLFPLIADARSAAARDCAQLGLSVANEYRPAALTSDVVSFGPEMLLGSQQRALQCGPNIFRSVVWSMTDEGTTALILAGWSEYRLTGDEEPRLMCPHCRVEASMWSYELHHGDRCGDHPRQKYIRSLLPESLFECFDLLRK